MAAIIIIDIIIIQNSNVLHQQVRNKSTSTKTINKSSKLLLLIRPIIIVTKATIETNSIKALNCY